MRGFVLIGRDPARDAPDAHRISDAPDWVQAEPVRIERALKHAMALPSGGWAVLDASARIGRTPRKMKVAGRTLVVWRGPDGPQAAPHQCPHMGASLCGGQIDDAGRIVCPWHGLALGGRDGERHGGWAPLPTHDDGVLSWVRMRSLLHADETPTEAPILPPRPPHFIDGVIRMEAVCEPRDIIANRLDPWHGAHYHPHSFLHLEAIEEDETQVTVRVVYKVLGPIAMKVDARFHCPDPRTIVMTIIAGDGVGSVVETHATPIDATHSAVIEATLATSERVLFPFFAKARRLIRPMIERRAARLWVEDCDYAEQTYARRHEGKPGRDGRSN